MPEAAAAVGPLGLDKHLDLLTLRLPGRPLDKQPSDSSDMSNAPIRDGPAYFTFSVATPGGLRAASRPKTNRRGEAQSAQACPHGFEWGRPGWRRSSSTGIMSADRFDADLDFLFGRCMFRTVVHFGCDDAGENGDDLSLAV